MQFHGGLIKIAWTSFAYLEKSADSILFLAEKVTNYDKSFGIISPVVFLISAFQGIIKSNTLTPSGTVLFWLSEAD